MIAHHIHDALAQVRTLRSLVLEKGFFKGYSGYARLASGVLALAAGLVLSADAVPATPRAHVAGWVVVLAVSLAVNYGAVAYWFFFDPDVGRDPTRLKPALDALPPLAVGGLLSLGLVRAGEFDLLFGAWTAMYGLAQVAYRQSLPRGIYVIGMLYVLAGAALLLLPGVSFVNPWPMAAVFFVGEWIGGAVLLTDPCLNDRT